MALRGDEIKKARERKGLTQRELAKRIGAVTETVNRWEANAHAPGRYYEGRLAFELGIGTATRNGRAVELIDVDQKLDLLLAAAGVISSADASPLERAAAEEAWLQERLERAKAHRAVLEAEPPPSSRNGKAKRPR